MRPAYITPESLDSFINAALEEDIRDGDHSSLASIPANAKNKAYLLMKASGIIAGMELAEIIFKKLDPEIKITESVSDGTSVMKGDMIMKIHGNSRAILAAERLVLNCMQRMSAIATYTHHLTALMGEHKARLLDTRKTTPNFRMMEKWAVLIGGGVNHRFGLFDMVMLKDNHIDFSGGVKNAIQHTLDYLKSKNMKLPIEVEVRSIAELEEVLEIGQVHRVLLDNMLPSDIREAIKLIDGQFETEASGGINEKNIVEMAETGVDFISVGALTHSYQSKDMSLKAV